ncbi:hypothetical protein [Streptomyces sp. CRN 30]|uniref:hypothetical protein n=1 Tax=Streptomyces sp. CRN 30 TaxID=3075613 RepID=UPI002A8306E5|nr:hypothetical protein [Streptomyces sp. CRN 30]
MEIPDDLIALERAAEEARARLAGLDGDAFDQQRAVWREAAAKVQAAIVTHAGEKGVSRYELEMAVKRAVRSQEEDPAE